MATAITTPLHRELLELGREYSDRWVLSRHFVPLTLKTDDKQPILTLRQQEILVVYVTTDPFKQAATGLPLLFGDKGIIKLHGKTNKGNEQAVATPQPDPRAIETLLALTKSEIGYLFLDRTRIRPNGFAIGEHVYTLSLAPSEEVVVEQRTFSKRQATLEDQTETEQQFDLELSSALSTELQEGLERQENKSTTSGLSTSTGLGAAYEGAQVNATLSYSDSLTAADNDARTQSVRLSSNSSRRVASKYRSLHRVTFKVSTEAGFEASSKRVLKNPSRYVPIDLHYFKVLQKIELTQERRGVRLCWAPCVRDPGFELFGRMALGRQEIMERAEAALPPAPPEPKKQQQPGQWAESGRIEAKEWGWFGSMAHDYTLEMKVAAGFVWDGNAKTVKDTRA